MDQLPTPAEWRFFTERELACRCCGHCWMNGAFMARLVGMRRNLGFPFLINSAYRCPTHNQRVSSTGPNGPHVRGRAVDIRVFGERALAVIGAAQAYGFTGVGVKQHGAPETRFIHLDDLSSDAGPRPWVWTYS